MSIKHIYKFEIDNREKEFTKEVVVNKFKNINSNVYTRTLDLGDFVFYDGIDESIIVERKEARKALFSEVLSGLMSGFGAAAGAAVAATTG